MPCLYVGKEWEERLKEKREKRRIKLLAMGLNPRGSKFLELMYRR